MKRKYPLSYLFAVLILAVAVVLQAQEKKKKQSEPDTLMAKADLVRQIDEQIQDIQNEANARINQLNGWKQAFLVINPGKDSVVVPKSIINR